MSAVLDLVVNIIGVTYMIIYQHKDLHFDIE